MSMKSGLLTYINKNKQIKQAFYISIFPTPFMGTLHEPGVITRKIPALRVHDIHEVHSFPPVTWRMGVIAKSTNDEVT